jgi:hypothetical protein
MLSIVDARVLGCLLEKERTVPDQYPLSLNALVSACNQSTAREPIMQLDDHEVEASVSSLKAAGLLRFVHPTHGRGVTRYRQVADESWGLEPDAAAVVAVLLLRGPQTVSEIRTRTERQHVFGSLDDVQRVLDELSERELVRLLERQPGEKAPRWQQLVADEPERPEGSARAVVSRSGSAEETAELRARIEQLEARVVALEAALADLL